MSPLSVLAVCLAASFLSAVLAKTINYQRWAGISCWIAWMLLFLSILGLPWLVLFRLAKQDEWVNRLFLRLELSRLPIQDRAAIQSVLEAWREKHAQVKKLPDPMGFGADSDERIDWLTPTQVLARYAESKPYFKKDAQSGLSFLYLNPPRSSPVGFYTSNMICLARTGPAEYAVYSEHYLLY